VSSGADSHLLSDPTAARLCSSPIISKGLWFIVKFPQNWFKTPVFQSRIIALK
jgi:hypothetical protein